MIFKPGDIVVWHSDNEEVYFIVEVNLEKKEYRVFVLNHYLKERVGVSHTLWFLELKKYILLKDKKL